MTYFDSIIASAEICAARGWSVLTLHGIKNGRCTCTNSKCNSPGKHPIFPGWQKRATSDIEILRRLPKDFGGNIGIVTGGGGPVVLDIDPRNGGDESFDHMISRFGSLPDTVEAHTGGGGRHILFDSADREIGNAVGFSPGLDLKGRGGFVVIEPSRHISGNSYIWDAYLHPETTPLAKMPHWLIQSRNENRQQQLSHGNRPSILSQPIAVGSRNNQLTKITGFLCRKSYFQPEDVIQLVQAINCYLCKPPLSSYEAAQIATSIYRKEANRRAGGKK